MENHAQPRLILPVMLLKAVQQEGKFKHSGKHILINGRWHRLHPDMKGAPKGAPVAHNPHAHAVAPAKHMSDDEWSQLHLPAENTNAGHYNGQLAKLKEWSEAGHAGALLGHSYGTNTYGQKLAKIANHLLGKMGSQHKVAAGQKAGEHAAIKAPEHEADAAPAADHKHTGPTQGETTGPTIAELQDQGHLPKTEQAAANPKAALDEETLPPLPSGLSANSDPIVSEAHQAAMKGDVAAIDALIKQVGSEYSGGSTAWHAIAGHLSDIKEAMQDKAEFNSDEPGPKDGDTKPGANGTTLVFKDGRWHAQGEAPRAEEKQAAAEPAAAAGLAMPEFQEGKTVSGVKDYYEKVAKQVMDLAEAGNIDGLAQLKAMGLKPNHKGKVSNTWAGKTPNSKILLALHKQAMEHAKEIDAEPPAPEQEIPVEDDKPAAQAGTGDEAADELEKLTQDIAAAGNADKAYVIAEDYALKHKQAPWAMSDAIDALQAAGYSDKAKVIQGLKDLNDADEAKAKETAQATDPTPAPAADTGALSAAQLQALQSIPWHKLKLPDTNSNAASVNKKLKALEDAAFAGDVAAIEAMTWGKNTYNKKLELAAKTAIAALKENAQTQVSQSAAPAAPSVTPAADAEGKPFTYNGYTYKKDPSSSTGWSYLMAGLGKWHEVANAEVLKELPGAEKAVADAGGLPQKPTDLTGYKHDADDIELALMNGDAASVKEILNALGEEVSSLTNLGKVQAYGKAALAHLEQKGGAASGDDEDGVGSISPSEKAGIMAWLNSDDDDTSPEHAKYQTLYHSLKPSLKKELVKEQIKHAKEKEAAQSGPKDGDTKQGADGMLVFKDGRWHKVGEKAAASAGPVKPEILTTTSWSVQADAVEHAMAQGDMAAIESQIALTEGLYSPGAVALNNYAKAAKAHLEAKAGQQPAAAAPAEPEPEQHPLDAVPVPDDIKNAPNKNWSAAAFKSIAKLKEKLKAGDAEVLKGATKFMSASGKYIVKLPHYNDSYSASGLKSTYKGNGGAAKALYEYVESLKAAMGKPAKKKAAAKPAAAAPAPVQFGQPEAMDSWVQTGGQGGSNPGGKFKDHNGVEWYCKFPDDDDTAKSEVLAAKLYAAAGLAGQDAKLITKGGKIGIASKWVDLKKAGGADALAKVDGVHAGFGVDAWLANWDVVGLALDNLQIGPDGKAMRVDAGGSLEYRAQGAKKPFGNEVQEIDTLLDAKLNPKTAAVFGSMTEADKIASVAKVLKISDVAIRALVNQYGPGDAAAKQKLADTLIARKADLAKKFPQAAKSQKKVVFKPEEISAPPSFTNWGGSGKSGPSSKEFVNQANEEAVQAIFATAKTGDIEAVKNLTAKTYNKDTGAVTGEAKVLEHPSQHVKGYAQQVINEINYQLNPPKKFRFEGGHPLHALNDAYPAHHGGPASATAQKLGKYIVLGEPGTISADDLQLPPAIKHTSAGGTLTTNTYAKAAQAAVAKMPKTQQQAIQSYTGSSYHEMNGSLWSGNPTGAAKAAGEALKTLGHDIEPGTLLSRKISLHGADLDALLKSTGKVLQEPAIMSTSIRPSSWSGNVQLKLRVGPGVKGLWVGHGSLPGGGAMSKHAGEDEMILPPNTRLMVVKVSKGADADGFGAGGSHVIECVVLPTQ